MAFVITETCIDTRDQACVDVCPVDCIHFEEGADRMLYINPAECIDCGACQPACPVSAIFPEGDVPANLNRFIEINSLWYEDAAAARAKVGAGGAPAAAPAAAAPAAEAASDAPAAEATAEAPAAEAPAVAPAAKGKAAPAVPAAPAPAPAGTYKFGENGVEGKCVFCGQYVIKAGIRYGKKSVLCPECAEKYPAAAQAAAAR